MMNETQLSAPKSWKDVVYTIFLAIIAAIAQELVRNPSKITITFSTYVIRRESYMYPVEIIDYIFVFTLLFIVIKLEKVFKDIYEHIDELYNEIGKLKRKRWRRR